MPDAAGVAADVALLLEFRRGREDLDDEDLDDEDLAGRLGLGRR